MKADSLMKSSTTTCSQLDVSSAIDRPIGADTRRAPACPTSPGEPRQLTQFALASFGRPRGWAVTRGDVRHDGIKFHLVAASLLARRGLHTPPNPQPPRLEIRFSLWQTNP